MGPGEVICEEVLWTLWGLPFVCLEECRNPGKLGRVTPSGFTSQAEEDEAIQVRATSAAFGGLDAESRYWQGGAITESNPFTQTVDLDEIQVVRTADGCGTPDSIRFVRDFPWNLFNDSS